MKIFVRTRTYDVDYAFLVQPPTDWWVRYRKQASTEAPALLMESDAATWRLLLSGIDSTRIDSGGRRIRYTLVLQGDHRETDDELDVLMRLTGRWLVDLPAGRQLGTSLDEVFSEPEIARLRDKAGDMAENDVSAHVRKVAATLDAVRPPGIPLDTHWLGSSRSDQKHGLVPYVSRLARDTAGFAAYLHMVGGSGSIVDLFNAVTQPTGVTAVLFNAPQSAVEEAKKPAARAEPPSVLKMLAWALAIAAGVGLVIWWLIRRWQ